MNEERIQEVFSDEEFVKEMFSKETPEEVQALLAGKDIELTVEEIVQLKEILVKKLQQAEDGEELGEDDLEDVAGGSVTVAVLAGIASVAVPLAIGVGFVAAVEAVNRATNRRW